VGLPEHRRRSLGAPRRHSLLGASLFGVLLVPFLSACGGGHSSMQNSRIPFGDAPSLPPGDVLIKEPPERDLVRWTTRKAKWSLAAVPVGRVVKIGVSAGQCDGLPATHISRVRIRSTHTVVFVSVSVTTAAPEPSRMRRFHEACIGVGKFVERTLRLPRPLGQRALCDAGFGAPLLRWPGKGPNGGLSYDGCRIND
jgi:hypothetical protein